MKKNQNGVSLISLIITIIVVIILAGVAFISSGDTIQRSRFSDFQNDIAEVEQMVEARIKTEFGDRIAEGGNLLEEQARNYVAKGASGEKQMLPIGIATQVKATHINEKYAGKTFGSELPVINVNTAKSSKVPVSYFLTKGGKVFIWPPYYYELDGLFYINRNDTVRIKSGDSTPQIKVDLNNPNDTALKFNSVFKDTITLVIGSGDTAEEIQIANNTDTVQSIEVDATGAITNMPNTWVYFKDDGNRKAPIGIETNTIYSQN